jgi:hypothetical protein
MSKPTKDELMRLNLEEVRYDFNARILSVLVRPGPPRGGWIEAEAEHEWLYRLAAAIDPHWAQVKIYTTDESTSINHITDKKPPAAGPVLPPSGNGGWFATRKKIDEWSCPSCGHNRPQPVAEVRLAAAV